jgi:hypothetical protein
MEIISIYTENYMKLINTLCIVKYRVLNVKQVEQRALCFMKLRTQSKR